ncbi:hypothetical protein PRK78_005407 [Emydomyces testavorans]|uniref:DUF1917-domain-containing protein n=1 Tax=Emydomyces testavorans TaxID=2070801 RepID=A0AAF0DJK9_9EURO|nr:hypothetical protein PRK78_005407 [Emydomyces testavorans]
MQSLDSFLSDESSFYGDEEQVSEMEDRAAEFDPMHYWRTSHATNLAVIAASQQAATENGTQHTDGAEIIETKSTCRHPHDGHADCYQRTESVASFLNRLPPSTTKASDLGPWIYIANRNFQSLVVPRVRRLVEEGRKLLEEFEEELSEIQEDNKDKSSSAAKSAVTRKINKKRRKLEADLLQVARDTGVITGKWMLFPSEDKLDEIWAAVAGATAKGALGVGAKVATKPDDEVLSRPRLICVYTKDFQDKEDIRRVLLKLVDLGLVSKGRGSSARSIYYKCDAYTHLDIKGGNPWGLKPSMYSSSDILASK